jgi:transposase
MDQCSTGTTSHQHYRPPHQPPGHDLVIDLNKARGEQCSPAAGSGNRMPQRGAAAVPLGVNSETLRKWLRRSEIDAGARPGVTSEELAEIRRLKKENAELRRTNEILRTASAFFAAELDRPAPR